MQLRSLPMVLVGIFFTADAMFGHVLEAADTERPNIVVPVSAHPAFDKACHYFGLEIRRTPLREDRRANPEAMAEAIDAILHVYYLFHLSIYISLTLFALIAIIRAYLCMFIETPHFFTME